MLSIKTLALGLALTASVNAHFLLNYPSTVGFDDDNEAMAPCGGFPVDYTKGTNFFVGGDAIAVQSTHPSATWLYRATLDKSASGAWTTLLPPISQASLGKFCSTGVQVPAAWAGQKGVIQVIQDAVDGKLYQCGAVTFVAGANPSVPAACVNGTSNNAAFTQATGLSAIPTAKGTLVNNAAATAAATTGPVAAATSKAAATAAAGADGLMGAAFWGAIIVVGVATTAFSL